MRKGLSLLVILLVIGFFSVYLFIPSNIAVKKDIRVPANAKAITRSLLYGQDTLAWPGNEEVVASDGTHFSFRGNNYALTEKRQSSLVFAVTNQNDSMLAELVLIPFQTDTAEIAFLGIAKASANPFRRIKKYTWAKAVGADLAELLQRIKAYYQNEENLYGYRVRKEQVADSTLVSLSTRTPSAPSTATVYALIDRLRAFAKKYGADSTGHPMLNVLPNGDGSYLTRVALPVNKQLPNEGEIKAKWMMGRGNILAMDVKGGPAQIEQAFAAMEAYAIDHHWTTAAIPFQSLVTDRRSQPDSSKWVTKLYWPVM